MLLDPLLFFAVPASRSLLSAACVAKGLALDQGDRHFDAPKARLFELVLYGLFRDSPVLACFVLAVGVAIVFGVPMFLAWDFAKGERRRTWVWVAFAAVASWLVLPAFWIASSRSGGEVSNRTGTEP